MFDVGGQGEAIWLNGFGLKWPMCRDRHPEIFWKVGQIWQNSGSGRGIFSDFSDFPQMENRDLGWTGLGLGSPKTLFSAKKHRFLSIVWPFPIIWGFPLGPLLAPIGPIGAGGSGEAFRYLEA